MRRQLDVARARPRTTSGRTWRRRRSGAITPPTHVVVAFNAALDQYVAEGGQPARLARYTAQLRDARRRHDASSGFTSFLEPEIQAPIIVTFHAPADPRYEFKEFYDRVRDKGFILYPGKLTQVETFRVGCIGAIGPDEMRHAVNAVRDTLAEMGIRQVRPLTRGAPPPEGGAMRVQAAAQRASAAGASMAPCRSRQVEHDEARVGGDHVRPRPAVAMSRAASASVDQSMLDGLAVLVRRHEVRGQPQVVDEDRFALQAVGLFAPDVRRRPRRMRARGKLARQCRLPPTLP